MGCSGKDESTTETKPVEAKVVEVKEEVKNKEPIAVAKPVEEKVLEDIKTIEIALLNYKISVYSYPTTDQGLQALLTNPADARRWNGPYLDGKITDPWGNGYVYRFPSQKGQRGPDIFSKGADGQENTADDIGNWQLRASELEGVNAEELEERESIWYLKDSETPYSGKVYALHPNGQKDYEINYKDGKRDGPSVIWHKNGQKKGEANFKDGILISEKFWNSKGESVDSREEAEAE